MLKDLRELRAMCRQARLSYQITPRWIFLKLLIPPYDHKLLPECSKTFIGSTVCALIASSSFSLHHHALTLPHDTPL